MAGALWFSLLAPSVLFVGCAAVGGGVWAGLAFLRAPVGRLAGPSPAKDAKHGYGENAPEERR